LKEKRSTKRGREREDLYLRERLDLKENEFDGRDYLKEKSCIQKDGFSLKENNFD